jgi:hypothetical protein
VQCTLRAHRQRVAQSGLTVGGTDRRDHDFIGAAALLDTQRFFDRDGIEGLIASLTPSSITPDPSGFTRMRTL